MQIQTLVPDIYRTIKNKNDGWFTAALGDALGTRISSVVRTQLGDERPQPRLRISKLGPQCPRALWYSLYRPELAVPLEPWAEIKFSFGHILEALAITLAKASGHEVTGEQDAVSADGILGHRDCVIDGCIVDVKSSSSLSMAKFRSVNFEADDNFGYLDQLDGYLYGSADDPLVTVKDRAYILAIDKQLGSMVLYEHKFRPAHIKARIASHKRVAEAKEPPACQCGTRPYGLSGNIELDVRASYSDFKWACHPHLRCFKYADKPVYFTKVVKRPQDHIRELNKYGQQIF